MKRTLICIFLIIASELHQQACSQSIICGWEPGEIYFVGVHPRIPLSAGFYFSRDCGVNIELRDSVQTNDFFGILLADAEDNAIHRFADPIYVGGHLLSRDCGFSWEIVNPEISIYGGYATGATPGEVYREYISSCLERSVNYGQSYSPCSTLGFPDTLGGIGSTAVGADFGEVYIFSEDEGYLYYSFDYAEHFIFLGDLYASAGVEPQSELVNATQPGAVYIFNQDTKKIWLVYDYGAQVTLIADFPYGFGWSCGMAAGMDPGEIYFLAVAPDFVCGGTMEIYHTNNYGQSWTVYEHFVRPDGIMPSNSQTPSDQDLQVWPNPANPGFTIEYNLNRAQTVNLSIFNSTGQLLWQRRTELQVPGEHQVLFNGGDMSSGIYIIQLITNENRQSQTLTIKK